MCDLYKLGHINGFVRLFQGNYLVYNVCVLFRYRCFLCFSLAGSFVLLCYATYGMSTLKV